MDDDDANERPAQRDSAEGAAQMHRRPQRRKRSERVTLVHSRGDGATPQGESILKKGIEKPAIETNGYGQEGKGGASTTVDRDGMETLALTVTAACCLRNRVGLV